MAPLTEILTIGDELLTGEVLDTNAGWLASRLRLLGLPVSRIVTLGDAPGPLRSHLEEAARRRVDMVITTGGLGPTEDDRTAAVVADVTGRELLLDERALEALRQRFSAAGYPLTPNNEKQVHFPRGATVIPNARGTAPGFMVRWEKTLVVCLPGVPAEMRGIFDNVLEPLLTDELGALSPARVRVFRIFGLGESQIDQRLLGLLSRVEGAGSVSVHYRTSFPENHVTVVVHDPGPEVEDLLHRLEVEIRRRLGRALYGVDQTTFSDAVVEALGRAGATVALAESCTGGLAGDLLTRASGSSSVFQLGVITYSNAFKHQILGVPREVLDTEGAVSAACVKAMAEGVRRLAQATFGVAISGVAGPTGGTPDKPVGTVFFGLAGEEGTFALHRCFPFGERQRIKQVSAHTALALLLRHLSGAPSGGDPFEGRWRPAGEKESG